MSRQSNRSTASVSVENPSVVLAVEHLQELGDRMKNEHFGFKTNDVGNIDRVVEAVQGLEAERLKVHEELETETIRGSVLRHRLLFYPSEIQKEIDDAVISARQSNAEAQKSLQEKLESIYKNVEFLEERQRELEKENSVLHPERELIRQQHEEIISQLNQRMAEKAGMQITLNETRDKVRQANQCILDLEDGIIQLKEDLIQERQEAREEKKRLKKAVSDTAEKTKEQKEENVKKKKEMDGLKEELMESEGQLEAHRKSIRRLEHSKGKLEEKERTLSVQLDREKKDNDMLERKGMAIIEEDRREQEQFDTMRAELEEQIRKNDIQIANETKRSSEIEVQHVDLQVEVKKKLAIRKEDLERVNELDKMLQNAKQALSNKAEEVGRLQAENLEMQQTMEDLEESHKAVVSQLNSQIEEHRGSLGKERQERMELQGTRDNVQKDLDEIKQDNQVFMTEMNKKIHEGKSKHVELSKEGTYLQKQLREDEGSLKKFQEELETAEKQFTSMHTQVQSKVSHTEEEIACMERSLVEKKEKLTETSPNFEVLGKSFDDRVKAYDKMKKDIVVKKNEKNSLTDSIKRVRQDKEKLLAPQTEMRECLKQKRRESVAVLKRQAGETKEVEKEIFLASCKLEAVLDENEKFRQRSAELERNIVEVTEQKEDNIKMKDQLNDQMERLRDELIKGWRDDREMEQLFAMRDEAVVDELSQILQKTERREVKISDITGQLQSELVLLGKFLDNVSSRRPIDTREGKRPAVTQQQDPLEVVAQVNTTATDGDPANIVRTH